MDPQDIQKLRTLTDFPALVAYLRDELDWPIEVEDADDITFDYDPAELGIDSRHAVKIESIKQVRPLVDTQPWGIFYIEFETKRLPVVVLRRILRSLVPKSRRRDPNRPVWRMDDLLFISAQGEAAHRRISFAHFRQREGRIPELRTFSWDTSETHFYYIKNLNLEALKWPDDETNADAWREQWSRAFTVAHRYTIRKSQELAREMARHAATVRDLVSEVYALETEDGPLHRLYASFKEVLLHDLTPDAFADMVAQTVAYGLFSAATQSDDLTYDRLVELIPSTNPFLKDLLAELTAQGAVDAVDLEELGVGQLVELLRQTDIEAIVHDFGRQTGGGREDPVVHFYELFLSEYDRAQKVKRGVFYTPDPVVSYIVRSVDYLLKTEFGLEDGLADTSVDPKTGEPLVQILDPATGTGTFLAHVIDQIWRTVTAKPGADWNAYVTEHLLPRLNGFELMMAPYAVAHMKLGLKLRHTGYDFSGNERLRVYLTNTLEEPVEMHETLALIGFLSKEANEAARVKRRKPITVVIGNPPYAGHSANESEWIAGLLRGTDSEGRRVESYFEVDGHGLGERNPKWLNDDYVKFIRFGQWRIEQTGAGVLAFITNHGYLDNPTFRGMRQSLMAAFDVIYVLDLHGSSKKRETTPEGGPDENVFDIMPGVAILLAVKRPAQTSEVSGTSEVYHADLWGLRGQKYAQLLKTDVSSTAWQRLFPSSPFYLFVPQDVALQAEYQQGWKITEAMPTNSMGITTGRDAFAIDYAKEELQRRISVLQGSQTNAQIQLRYGLKDSSSFSLEKARLWSKTSEAIDFVLPISYRCFDQRYMIYSSSILARSREEICRHQIGKENLTLATSRAIRESPWLHIFVARHPIAKEYVSSLDNCFAFPLYLYPLPDQRDLLNHQDTSKRQPNLNPDLLQALAQAYGEAPAPEVAGEPPAHGARANHRYLTTQGPDTSGRSGGPARAWSGRP